MNDHLAYNCLVVHAAPALSLPDTSAVDVNGYTSSPIHKRTKHQHETQPKMEMMEEEKHIVIEPAARK